jgi:GNAT superfamily N-acetyltransferase
MLPGMASPIGERSERLVQPLDAVLTPRDGYHVVRQPDYPGYWYGNCLILAAPPAPGDLGRWLAVWRDELGGVPGLRKIVLCSEQPEREVPAGLPEAAAEAGLELEVNSILVLDRLHPHPAPEGVVIAPVREDEWAALVELDVAHSPEPPFRRWRMGEYRRLVERGTGRWWAARVDGEIVASAGLFAGGGLARYQHVLTHRDFRRRGIAAALVSAMAADHLAAGGSGPVLIVADRDSSAERIYRRIGFTHAATGLDLLGDLPEVIAHPTFADGPAGTSPA